VTIAFVPAPESPFATLRQFAKKRSAIEKCELCKVDLAPEHQHLLEPEARKLVCACDACAILFSHREGTKFKRVPRDVSFLKDFRMTNGQWEALMIPIGMAFFHESSVQKKVVAYYPSPAGATESLLNLDSWKEIVEDNPELKNLQPDVEALLVNRVNPTHGFSGAACYVVPIDECYRLVGLIRAHWQGFSGGNEVWQEIERFFGDLRRKAGVDDERSDA
jgi:hypothetical protein